MNKAQNWVPLSIRREVSVNSKGVCGLCKIKASFAEIGNKKIPKFFDKNRKPFEIDHIIEIRNGGTNEKSNLRIVCGECNRGRPRMNVKTVRGVENVVAKYKKL